MFGLLLFAGVRFFRLVALGFFFGDGPLAVAVAVAPTFIEGDGCACDGVGASGGNAGVVGDGDVGVALGSTDGFAFLVSGVAPVAIDDDAVDASSAALCFRDRSCLALLDLSIYDASQIGQTCLAVVCSRPAFSNVSRMMGLLLLLVAIMTVDT